MVDAPVCNSMRAALSVKCALTLQKWSSKIFLGLAVAKYYDILYCDVIKTS